MNDVPDCPLCSGAGEHLIWTSHRCRVIRVDDTGFPGYCRVVWNKHAVEMSDLNEVDRVFLMAVVVDVESAVREVTRADKINLASFGNVVPHLHWHVIPRWHDDSHFPQPIWGQPMRPVPARRLDFAAIDSAVCRRLQNRPDCSPA